MKILYLAPAMADYQSDALFHGLRSLLGADVVDATKLTHMYQGGPVPEYGRGFTLFNLLPDIPVDREDIAEKIKEGYFDLVIVAGDYAYRPEPFPYFNWIRMYVSPGRLFIIDGSDEQDVASQGCMDFGTLFKREHTNFGIPIFFAIPHEKLKCGTWPRGSTTAAYKPGMAYLYDKEDAYYEGYRTADFAHTQKKAGWDCLRHCEIMAAGCIPIFDGIEKCPPTTCLSLPKSALARVVRDWTKMTQEEIAAVGQQMFTWCETYCTTEHLAKYVLSHAQQRNPVKIPADFAAS